MLRMKKFFGDAGPPSIRSKAVRFACVAAVAGVVG